MQQMDIVVFTFSRTVTVADALSVCKSLTSSSSLLLSGASLCFSGTLPGRPPGDRDCVALTQRALQLRSVFWLDFDCTLFWLTDLFKSKIACRFLEGVCKSPAGTHVLRR